MVVLSVSVIVSAMLIVIALMSRNSTEELPLHVEILYQHVQLHKEYLSGSNLSENMRYYHRGKIEAYETALKLQGYKH